MNIEQMKQKILNCDELKNSFVAITTKEYSDTHKYVEVILNEHHINDLNSAINAINNITYLLNKSVYALELCDNSDYSEVVPDDIYKKMNGWLFVITLK